MRLDLAVNAAGPIMHYEDKFISLFLFPYTSSSCMFAIVNCQNVSMTNLPGCSTTTPCIGFGVSLSHFCFQPVTDKRERTEGGVCVELGK